MSPASGTPLRPRVARLRRTLRRRLQRTALVPLIVIWVMLWGNVSWGNVIAGAVLAVGLLLLFPLPPVTWGVRLHPWPFVVLAVRFNIDLVRASVQMAYRSVAPWWHPQGRVLRVRLLSDNDFIAVVTAEMTALIPGSVVIDLNPAERWMLLHVFHAPGEQDLRHAAATVREQEIRVIKALALHKDHVLAGRDVPARERSQEELLAMRLRKVEAAGRTRAGQPHCGKEAP